jgi:predicted acyltransferase
MSSSRLTSLDVFRGISIASMILVNNPGSWKYVYPPLDHAEWHGCTPTDLVFPFFLFIVGVSIAFSLSKDNPEPQPTHAIYLRIIRRSVLLFLLGLMLNFSTILLDVWWNGAPIEDFAKLRIMGVLQRIGLAYFISAIVILHLSLRQLWILAGLLLLGYWGALTLIPVPGYGMGNLTPEGNLIGYIDRVILGNQHLLKGNPFDPEGLLSTLNAVVTVLIGYFTGNWLRNQPIKTETTINLVMFGLSSLIIGYLWGFLFPINKQLWTSSYVVYTAGWALLLFALCYEIIEIRGWRKLGFVWKVMGLNAIFVFVASGLLGRVLLKSHVGIDKNAPTTYTWIYQNWFQPWAGTMNGSLAFAIVVVLFWWIILYVMYRQKWFIKL